MFNDRDDPRYKKFRKSVLKRDKYMCQMPGCKYKKCLQVHHIQRWADAFHLRFEIDNAITLCYKCHRAIRNSEHCYIELFMDIVKTNNNQ